MVWRAAGREGGSEKGKSPVADFHWHPILLVILIGRGRGKPGIDPGEAAPSVSLLAIVQSSTSRYLQHCSASASFLEHIYSIGEMLIGGDLVLPSGT